MSDVVAILSILALFALSFPAYLVLVGRLFPRVVQRAAVRLTHTWWRCVSLGLMLAAGLAVPLGVLLLVPNGAVQLLGWVGLLGVLAVAGVGGAGLAIRLGGEAPLALWRGAITLELAMALPVLGWFTVVPLCLSASLGATAFALMGWMPRSLPAPEGATVATTVAL
jgi:hypothetical protein